MNTITGSIPVALQGIRTNLNGLADVSQQVASASVDGADASDYAVEAVKAMEYRNGVDASAAALKRANETLGSVLDVLV